MTDYDIYERLCKSSYYRRYWINQPSSLQQLHSFHGTTVLAPDILIGKSVTVYFLSGDIDSMKVDPSCLSRMKEQESDAAMRRETTRREIDKE